VIVLDCGATNLRAMAVDREGNILAGRSFANQTFPDPYFNNGRIWDTRYILDKLCEACRDVCLQLEAWEIKAVCTTSFGVDAAPYCKEGNQLYPVISWACERTNDILDEVHDIIPLHQLHSITGLNKFYFNTLYKLYWFRKNRKDILEKTHHWLFMPAIISSHLCGTMFTDVSMLGTSMLCDRKNRTLSSNILQAFGFSEKWFPGLTEAGEKIGEVSAIASAKTGLPAGTAVLAAGHDTQFAIFGSGAGVNEPVLSSGTWEILMVRTPEIKLGQETLMAGITTELDAVPGLYNPGMQWLGSKYIEEVKKEHFGDICDRDDIYDIMITEAEAGSKRGLIFKALLQELSEKTRDSLVMLEKYCGFKAERLRVVGGGSKNALWNNVREETLGIEVVPISQAETTVLGAAMFAFAGAGIYNSPEEARDAMLQLY